MSKIVRTISIVAIAILMVTMVGVGVQQLMAHRDYGGFAHRDTTVVRGPEGGIYGHREGTIYGDNGYAHRDTTIYRPPPQQSTYERLYELGWRTGYSDHIAGHWYLNLALSQAYARGYTAGWDSWHG